MINVEPHHQRGTLNDGHSRTLFGIFHNTPYFVLNFLTFAMKFSNISVTGTYFKMELVKYNLTLNKFRKILNIFIPIYVDIKSRCVPIYYKTAWPFFKEFTDILQIYLAYDYVKFGWHRVKLQS